LTKLTKPPESTTSSGDLSPLARIATDGSRPSVKALAHEAVARQTTIPACEKDLILVLLAGWNAAERGMSLQCAMNRGSFLKLLKKYRPMTG
jgi:hypothetical protein